MPFSIFYTINQENTKNFIVGPKPLGPNRERTGTSLAELEKGRNLWQPHKAITIPINVISTSLCSFEIVIAFQKMCLFVPNSSD